MTTETSRFDDSDLRVKSDRGSCRSAHTRKYAREQEQPVSTMHARYTEFIDVKGRKSSIRDLYHRERKTRGPSPSDLKPDNLPATQPYRTLDSPSGHQCDMLQLPA